jgi:hypothetical protein
MIMTSDSSLDGSWMFHGFSARLAGAYLRLPELELVPQPTFFQVKVAMNLSRAGIEIVSQP